MEFWCYAYGYFYTADTAPLGDEKPITLGKIVVPEETVPRNCYIDGVKVKEIYIFAWP
ncbi:MAG: hypothetical protein E6550_06745 [Veillonella sp.]|uniref:hypothetical protein n=1 Tax=Veillonella sp. TaxID=1926307 RepID=UPI0029107632|nr:hypothetical protein [Veillonella sp.]MDU6398351.1 hypothetical protein [Veillonella sp.]